MENFRVKYPHLTDSQIRCLQNVALNPGKALERTRGGQFKEAVYEAEKYFKF